MIPDRPYSIMSCLHPVGVVLLAATATLAGDDRWTSSAPENSASTGEIVNPAHAEIDLGEFQAPIHQQDTNTVITVFCGVFGTVRNGDLGRLQKELQAKHARVRQQLLAAIRASSRDELYEPNLTDLKQRLLKAVRARIDEPNVYRVGFTHFHYSEK